MIINKLVNYKNKYQIIKIPVVAEVIYGRKVGYKISKYKIGKKLEKISATNIRKKLKLSKIVWFTGLSGSGKQPFLKLLLKNFKLKSTKLNILMVIFSERKNINSFSRKNIILNNLLIINYIKKIQKKFDYVVISVISPLIKTRLIAKKYFKENYFEIFVFVT